VAKAPAAAAPVRQGFTPVPHQTCGGYPRLPIGMAKGMCAGLVLGPPPQGLRPSKRQLHLPRNLLPLPGGHMLVVDLGSWEPGHGAVWRMRVRPGAKPELTPLLSGLNLPHAIAFGPDGGVYLGEMDRISRFDPDAPDVAASVVAVVSGLPGNRLHEDRHPLSSFVFDADGDLLVNVGARSDQCPPQPGRPGEPCAEVQGDRPAAAVWRFAYLGAGEWDQAPTVFATGLRNSLALARHRSGAVFQAENSIDVDDRFFPDEEINRLEAGRNYGWPYCVEMTTPAPAWKGRADIDCRGKAYARPALLLPPHAAPIAMLYYEGAMFPELQGKLVISFHGYRSTGGRIVAYEVDAAGAPVPSRKPSFAAAGGRRAFTAAPAASGRDLTPGWNKVPNVRPMGAPAGMAVAADGALWVADDRNGAIIRIAREAPVGVR
jgi:glucose/arabinose dehydrogenase